MTPTASLNEMGRRDESSFDFSMVARGASTGFTILLLGGLIAPLVVNLVPVLGFVWLPVVALSAFTTASWRGTTPGSPVMHGGFAAVTAYLLVLPLVFLGSGGLDAAQVVATTATAVAVGCGAVLLRRNLKKRRRGEKLHKRSDEPPARRAEEPSDGFADEHTVVAELRSTPPIVPHQRAASKLRTELRTELLSGADAERSGSRPASKGR